MSDVNIKAPPNNHMTDVIALDVADAMTALGHDDADWLLKHDPNTLMQRVADELHKKADAEQNKLCAHCGREGKEELFHPGLGPGGNTAIFCQGCGSYSPNWETWNKRQPNGGNEGRKPTPERTA